jgi:hypothetical protein
MSHIDLQLQSGSALACLKRAASCLASCSRPALSIDIDSTEQQLSSALSDLVAAAELFGCRPAFWRWAADAAALLALDADADTYRRRISREV